MRHAHGINRFRRRLRPGPAKRAHLLLWLALTAAASPLSYRSFPVSSGTFFTASSGVLFYSSSSRSVRPVTLDESVAQDSVRDAVESDGYLWIAAAAGLYSLNTKTFTVEKISFAQEPFCPRALAADYDYVWALCDDALWQYDKLGREWFEFGAQNAGAVLGAYSTGDEVLCAYTGGMRIFSVSDEKWTAMPLTGKPLSPASPFFTESGALLFVDGDRIVRYVIDSRSWETINAGAPIVDVAQRKPSPANQASLYYLTASALSSYSPATSIAQRHDVANLAAAYSVVSISDSTVAVAAPDHILLYEPLSRSVQFLPWDPALKSGDDGKLLYTDGRLCVVGPQRVGLYDLSTKLWEVTPRGGMGGGGKRVSWDDNGLAVRYSRGYTTTLTGWAEQEMTFKNGVIFDTVRSDMRRIDSAWDSAGGYWRPVYAPRIDTVDVVKYTRPNPRLNLTLHTALAGSRFLDLYFDNSVLTDKPKKGLLYKGAPGDRFQSAVLGRANIDFGGMQTVPKNTFEGGALIVESTSKLAGRDRKIVRGGAGGGLITTRTRHEVLQFNPAGLYRVTVASDDSAAADTLRAIQVVPGSIRIWVDGEEIDSTYYSFVTTTGGLKFNREDIIDPQSVITISYAVETVADSGIETIELYPENNFGSVAYAHAAVSPAEWIGVRAGYTRLGGESARHLATASVPLEFRTNRFMFAADPEFTWDAAGSKGAGGFSMRSRIGKSTGLQFRGLAADRDFTTTDALTRGYGSITSDISYTLSHDIVEHVPVSYTQTNTRATGGSEDNFKLSGGMHVPQYPFLDVELSRNMIDAAVIVTDTVSDTADTVRHAFGQTDTLDRIKNKLYLRLYETSSPLVQKFLRLYKTGYELAWTEYYSEDRRAKSDGNGRIVYGYATVSPVQPVTVTVTGTYRKNPSGSPLSTQWRPSLVFQTVDVPRGVDVNGMWEMDFGRFAGADSSRVSHTRSLGAVLMPGKWIGALGWMSPRASLSQNVSCLLPDDEPSFGDVIVAADHRSAADFSREIGIHVFPNEDVLFRNTNVWTESIGPDKFRTWNDLKFWFQGKTLLWQTNYQFDTDHEGTSRNTGYSRVDYFQRSYAAVDGLWFMKIEEDGGFDKALLIDTRVWEVMGKIQARLIRSLIPGDGGPAHFRACFEAKLAVEGFEFTTRDAAGGFSAAITLCPWLEKIKKAGRGELAGRVGGRICPAEYGAWLREFDAGLSVDIEEKLCEKCETCAITFKNEGA